MANNSIFTVSLGVIGENILPNNAAVLTKERTIKGESKTEFIAITGVESTDGEAIIAPVLALMLADARERLSFEDNFKVVILNGTEAKSGIRAKSLFQRFLSGNVVYKTNGKGEMNKALVMDEGMRLSSTALRISAKQPIFSAKGKELKNIFTLTCKAIAKQANMCSGIVKKAASIYTEAVVEQTPKADKQAKIKADKQAESNRATA